MKAVLFDMDGVLFDSERAVRAAWREVAAELGLEGIDEVFLRCVGVNIRGTEGILRRAYPALDFEDFDTRVRARFRARWGGGRLPVKPGAREILTALRERGIPLALASSTRTETVRSELDEAGLLVFFDAVVGGDMVARSKPDPEIFLAAAALLGTAPADCFVIEDSFNGVRAAHAGGFRTVMVPDLLSPDAEMAEKADAIRPDLFAARDWLLARL
ncbi:MAG: HAD family phosphatase [Oscillospiraceae bacterium]|nr:HAD family phosphatase [Oscillospiraceae bacterium]